MNKSQKGIIVLLAFIMVGTFVFTRIKAFVEKTIIPPVVSNEVKNGEIKQYTSSGKLKTVINYEDGVKHGMSYLYQEDGETILLAMPYHRGKRDGIAKKYYRNGKRYAETSYRNDLLDGPRKVYYRSGGLKSIVPYYKGNPGIGTREFFKTGNEKTPNEISVSRKGDILYLNVEPACSRPVFYIGKLIQGQFFDPMSTDVKMLPDEYGQFYIDLRVFTLSYLSYQDIVCHCESSQKNPIVLQKKIDL